MILVISIRQLPSNLQSLAETVTKGVRGSRFESQLVKAKARES